MQTDGLMIGLSVSSYECGAPYATNRPENGLYCSQVPIRYLFYNPEFLLNKHNFIIVQILPKLMIS